MNNVKYLVTLLYVLAGTPLFAQPGNVKTLYQYLMKTR